MILEDKLFSEADQNWDLPRIYADVNKMRKNLRQMHLSPLERACLRGLLLGYSPAQIASKIPGKPQSSFITNLVWGLHRGIAQMTDGESGAVESYQDIGKWLAQAGYQKNQESKVQSNQQKPISTERTQVHSEQKITLHSQPNSPQKSSQISVSSSPTHPQTFTKQTQLTQIKTNLNLETTEEKTVPQVPFFYGRKWEMATLKQWLGDRQCRLVAITGMVGIGKTALTAKVVEEVREEFDSLIWRNLRQAPPFEQLIAELIQSLQPNESLELSEDIYSNIAKLISHLQNNRCLIVFDDWQIIFSEIGETGYVAKEYQGYSELLKQIAEAPHQSCLLLNGTEPPTEITLHEGNSVHALKLEGLGKDAQEIFKARGLSGHQYWRQLIEIYRGNPQELKLVANTIKDIFGGNVAEFFGQQTYLGVIVHENSQEYLDETFKRLSPLEQNIMYGLAFEGKPIERGQLQERFQGKVYGSEITKALASLSRRSLIEVTVDSGKQYFSLQPVVMKHIAREYLPKIIAQQQAQQAQAQVKEQPAPAPPPPHQPPVTPQPNPDNNQTTALANQPAAPPPTTIPDSQKETGVIKAEMANVPAMQANDLMPPISRWTRLGGLFIAGAVGAAAILSAFTSYNVVVSAPSNVRPAGDLRIVQAQAGGEIQEILAEENQPVKRGDVIAVIDDSRLQTRKNQLENNIGQTKLQQQQINAQMDDIEDEVQAEQNRIKRSVDAAQAELIRSRRNLQDRQVTTVAAVEEAQANLRLTEKELLQAQATLVASQAELKSAEVALDGARVRHKRFQEVAASGALSKNQVEEAQLNFAQQQQAVTAQKAAVEQQKQQIERQKQAVEAARARVQSAQVAVNPSDADIQIAQQRIAQEQAAGKANLARLEQKRKDLKSRQIEIDTQLSRDEGELQQVEKELAQTEVKATAEGILFQLNLRNTGQTVRSGERIAEIVPKNSDLRLRALVPTQEITKVENGQKVQIRISACPYPDYGVLNGQVSSIGADVIPPSPGDGGQGASSVYEVFITPESLSYGLREDKQCELRLGLEGEAKIITKEETVLDFLLRKVRLNTDV